MLLGLLTAAAVPAVRAQEPESARVPAVVLGQKLALQTRGGEVEEHLRQRPKSMPIGHRVFRTVVEVEEPEAIQAGTRVDVFLVTLNEEGTKSESVLKQVRVISVEPTSQSLTDAPAAEMEEPLEPSEPGREEVSQDDEVYETRVVGFSVNGHELEHLRLAEAQGVLRLRVSEVRQSGSILTEILHNFTSNLFQPLLLFFFMGFAIPLLKVPFEFPKALYQSLTIYLLVAIGWHGGELMAQLPTSELAVAGGLALVGFCVNGTIGYAATQILSRVTRMRRIDAVTVGAYYGSDSAGTFVTCLGILATLSILHDSYMPVMLAVMEIPGCLVGLFLVSRLRQHGMDAAGNMPGEQGYLGQATAGEAEASPLAVEQDRMKEESFSAEGNPAAAAPRKKSPILSSKILHEVFLNPGLFLLFGGIVVGFISGLQALKDPSVVEGPNHLFLFVFKGTLCLFLLEMGMTACKRLQDLKTAGWGFIAFGLLAPVAFATFGMVVLHVYSLLLGHAFELGTYALFAVLCGAASYIAVPAVQRIAIPEASPTLPLAASLGLTFTWNVTIGIPIYIEIAKQLVSLVPVTT